MSGNKYEKTPESANVNYRYFVHFLKQLQKSRPIKALDYGCGQGTIVDLLRSENVDCCGVEICYAGANFDKLYASDSFKGGFIHTIPEGEALPFENNTFDVIFSNQVFEHIAKKREVLLNLKRVLKNDGIMRHHFPSKEVIREGHIGIPFVHWFQKGKLRYQYTRILRCLGFGYFKEGLSSSEWAGQKLAWLDDFCFYEPYEDLRRIMSEEFNVTHKEIEYIRFRAESRKWLRRLLKIELFRPLYESLFRRLAFMVLELRKCESLPPRDPKLVQG